MRGQNLSGLGLRWEMSSERETEMRNADGRGRRWARRASRLALIGAAVGTLLLLTAPRAAADYSVVQCAPGSQGYIEAAWTPFGSTGFSIWGTNECGPGGYGLRLDTNYRGAQTGWTGNGSGLAWRFTAPPATTMTSLSASLHYGDNGGFAAAYFSDGSPGFQVPDGAGGASSLFATAAASGAHFFEVRLQCFASPNCHSDWSYVWATNFSAAVRDESPPSISVGGGLLSGGVIRGINGLQATVTDSGGGARTIAVYVNGLASRGVDLCPPDYQGTSYTHLKPCPNGFAHGFAIDTEKDPGWGDGPNDIAICSTDVGGNSSPCLHRTVSVDNSCPGSGGTTAAVLDAGADVDGSFSDRAAITSNDHPVVRGALKDGAGTPVPGATVCVYQTIDLVDASRELVSKVTTQGNGRFATRLDAGPSRQLDLVYRHNDGVLRDNVELDSAAVPTLAIAKKRLTNGKVERFTGQLPGPNAEGRAVALQARAGRKWRTFKQLRTDGEGRFHGKYRFTQTLGNVRYVFRALVKRQAGYPYEPGHSRKRNVQVQG
jgi:5-hydroxyisourate hydrolase-like protein (transthyretin family)